MPKSPAHKQAVAALAEDCTPPGELQSNNIILEHGCSCLNQRERDPLESCPRSFSVVQFLPVQQ